MRAQSCFYLMSQSQHSRVIPPQSQPPVSRVTGDANLPALWFWSLNRVLLFRCSFVLTICDEFEYWLKIKHLVSSERRWVIRSVSCWVAGCLVVFLVICLNAGKEMCEFRLDPTIFCSGLTMVISILGAPLSSFPSRVSVAPWFSTASTSFRVCLSNSFLVFTWFISLISLATLQSWRICWFLRLSLSLSYGWTVIWGPHQAGRVWRGSLP